MPPAEPAAPARLRRLVAAAALLAAAGLGLAACTSTPGPTSAGSSTETSTTTGDTAEETTGAADTSATSAVPDGAFDAVLALIVERLDTAPQVAASKLFSGQPVTDPAREQVVLDTASAAAQDAGADGDYVLAVFSDQIAASKIVQQSLLDQWAAGTAPAPTAAPDLATEVRPILDRITTELVPALAAVQSYRADPGCTDAVDAARTTVILSSPEVATALPTSTAHLCV